MLTDINLDNERFDDLVEEAKNMIVSYYSEWTDFNYHDPGITISELFAFFKEIIQYRMNYIGEKHQLKYLKLMGISRRSLMPATARISLECTKTLTLPALTRFFASGICFESQKTKYLVAGDLKGCIYYSHAETVFTDQARAGYKMQPFGENPQQGDCFYLIFNESLPADIPLSIFVEVFNGYKVHRSLIKEGQPFFDIAVLELQAGEPYGFEKCPDFQDTTHGLVQSGWLNFTLSSPLKKITVEGQSGYMLRLCLVKSDYDIPPVITRIGMNYMDVVQTRHYALCRDLDCVLQQGEAVCRMEMCTPATENISVLIPDGDCYRIFENYTLENRNGNYVFRLGEDSNGILPSKARILSWEILFDMNQLAGEGDGLPFQEYSLGDVMPEAESFRIMIEEPGKEDCLREWQQVSDFSKSGPMDYHYVLDFSNKKIVFGDCIRGMAPEGKIFICQYVACEGERGNVKAHTIRNIEEGYEGILPDNSASAWGGADLETLEECFMDARKALYENGGLVTDADYVNAVWKTPGMIIENCQVIYPKEHEGAVRNGAHRISIVVKPFSSKKNPVLTKEYKKNIIAWLDPGRMIGTDIRLISPEYLKLNVFVECKGRNNYIFDREAIVKALNAYFTPFGRNFGKIVSQSEVYEILGRLDAVANMEALSIDVTGNNIHRTTGGEIILPPNGLISLEDIQYNININ